MSVRGTLARVIEANRISGVKAYGEGEYKGGQVVGTTHIQNLMQKSVETGRKLNEIMAKAREEK